ncbi:syntaxin binding protein 1, variant 2 [Bonamia ostreae]
MILQTSYANVPKSDIESLMESAKLNNKQKKACRNISFLGTTEEIPNETLERNKLIQKESKLNLSRYEPKIKNVLKEICEDTLSKKNFPYVQEPPPEKSMKRGRRKKNKEMCKIIVFVAGGLSYSEIRCCSEVSKTYSRDVIAGSTDVVSPKEFMRELIQIN